jgi:phosphatidate cytidylyltransferase
MFALVYVGVMLGWMIQLRMLWGIGALASLIIVVKMADTGAYAVGRLIGRHPMAPVLSPRKTLEGAVGGLLTAGLVSWAVFAWLVPLMTVQQAYRGAWWRSMLFGLVVGGAGMLGDLAESLLKRDVGSRDSSRWLPGFGGVLDLLDSLLLAAPVAWLCWALGLVG